MSATNIYNKESVTGSGAQNKATVKLVGSKFLIDNVLKLGIRQKLFISFGSIAALTVIASAIGVFFFHTTQDSFLLLAEKGIPAIRSVASLSNNGNSIALRSADLAKVQTEDEHNSAYLNLQEAIKTFKNQFDTIQSGKLISADTSSIKSISDTFESKVKEMGAVTKNRIAIRDRKAKKLARLFKVHEEVSLALAPIVDDAFFDVTISGETSAAQSGQIVDKLINKDVQALRSMLEARTETSLLSGLLTSAALTSDSAFIAMFQDKAIASLNRLNGALSNVKNFTDQIPAESKFKSLRNFVAGENSLFERDPLSISDFDQAQSKTLSTILRLQQEIDNVLTVTLDEKSFDLAIGAEQAVSENNAIITKLVENQVSILKSALESGGIVHQLVASLIRGSLTDNIKLIPPIQGEINRLMIALQNSLKEISDKKFKESVAELEIFVDQKDGLLSDRLIELKASQNSEMLASEMGQISHALSVDLNNLIAQQQQATILQTNNVKSDIHNGRIFLLIIAGSVILISALIGVFVVHYGLAKPMGHLTEAMRKLVQGDTEILLNGGDRKDEIGEMINAVLIFRDNAIEREQLSAAQKANEASRDQRQKSIEALIDDFRTTASDILTYVDSNMSEMQSTAQMLTGIAEETSGKTTSAACATDIASTNVQTVASTSEELSASIAEIADQVSHTTDFIAQATGHARDTNEKVASLADAAQKIGDVVNLIQDIAEQTNLLALNATIEAARAGESGKGFAVVAAEVKNLANQTARATEEIATQIQEIQQSTSESVSAIQDISRIMEDVNNNAVSISAAVEEQGAATSEISRTISEAAVGTRDASHNMSGVTEAVGETMRSASKVSDVSADAVRETGRLREAVHKFLESVAAA